jgi:hypothetical protein
MGGLERDAKVNSAGRQPDEDVGIGALGAVAMTAARSANAKPLREMGRDEAAALATAQMLAEAPKDRSADVLFAIALHDPDLKVMRSQSRSVSVARRLEFVADPTLSLPERARALSGIPPASSRAENDGSVPATWTPSCEPMES